MKKTRKIILKGKAATMLVLFMTLLIPIPVIFFHFVDMSNVEQSQICMRKNIKPKQIKGKLGTYTTLSRLHKVKAYCKSRVFIGSREFKGFKKGMKDRQVRMSQSLKFFPAQATLADLPFAGWYIPLSFVPFVFSLISTFIRKLMYGIP